jgi:hypothetical protein
MKSGARGVIVAVAICSWFAISNHCAFAALAAKTDTESHGCPFHSKPKEKPSGEAQCCKILRAVTPAPTKSWARDDAKVSGPDGYNREHALVIASWLPTLVPLSLATGPPRVRSFPELILQRSLPAHAPPIRA